jgi:hypothetical protein
MLSHAVRQKLIISVIAFMLEAVITSETSVTFSQNTQRNISEDGHLHTRRRENPKSMDVILMYFVRSVTTVFCGLSGF